MRSYTAVHFFLFYIQAYTAQRHWRKLGFLYFFKNGQQVKASFEHVIIFNYIMLLKDNLNRLLVALIIYRSQRKSRFNVRKINYRSLTRIKNSTSILKVSLVTHHDCTLYNL